MTRFKPWFFASEGILLPNDDDGTEIILGDLYADEPLGRLVEAAPDLYNALWELLQDIRMPPGADPEDWARRYNAAKAALRRVDNE